MIITPKDYAMSLFRATKSKTEKEVKSVINNFVDLIIRNNDLSKTSKILDIFSTLWNKENNIVEAEIIAAKKLDRGAINSLENFIIKLSGAKKVKIAEKINEDILGGAIIRYEDKIIDKSLKTKIKNLSNSIRE